MKKILLLIILLNILSMCFASDDDDSSKIKIAVLKFKNETEDKFYDYLENEFQKRVMINLRETNYFKLSTVDEIDDLDEYYKMYSIIYKHTTADVVLDVANLLFTDYIIFGTYNNFDGMIQVKLMILDRKKQRLYKHKGYVENSNHLMEIVTEALKKRLYLDVTFETPYPIKYERRDLVRKILRNRKKNTLRYDKNKEISDYRFYRNMLYLSYVTPILVDLADGNGVANFTLLPIVGTFLTASKVRTETVKYSNDHYYYSTAKNANIARAFFVFGGIVQVYSLYKMYDTNRMINNYNAIEFDENLPSKNIKDYFKMELPIYNMRF